MSDHVQDWLDAHPYFVIVSLGLLIGIVMVAFAFSAMNGSLIGCVMTGLLALGLFTLLANEAQAEQERRGNQLFEEDYDGP